MNYTFETYWNEQWMTSQGLWDKPEGAMKGLTEWLLACAENNVFPEVRLTPVPVPTNANQTKPA